MYERVVLQYGQDRRCPDAVVGAEGCAVGRHPLAVDIGLDRVLEEVEHLVVVLLRHHVQMGLQDHPFAVLHARRRGLAHIDVVGLVLAALQPEAAGRVEDVPADLLLVVRRTGNIGDPGKMLPDQSGFQSGQFLIHGYSIIG